MIGEVTKFTQSRTTTSLAGSALAVVTLTNWTSEVYYNYDPVVKSDIPPFASLEITGKTFPALGDLFVCSL